MRTLLSGLEAFRRKPLAIVPISLESIVLALAVAFGLLRPSGTVVAAGAVFPFDVYFDVKQAIASTDSWVTLVIVLVASVVCRSTVLVLTLAWAEGTRPSAAKTARAALTLTGTLALAFVPVAILFLAGTAVRYAPFIWIGAPIGLGIALTGARRALRLDVGSGSPGGDSVPEAAPFLAYAYFVALVGAATSFIGDVSTFLAVPLIASIGPMHALVLLGWRHNARAQVYPGGGLLALTATVVLTAMLGVGTFYDRIVRSPSPVGETSRQGTVALLGGADSTHRTGSIAELDVRSLGYGEDRARYLSYSARPRYTGDETHQDLDVSAQRVADQLETLSFPEALVGHSQAALILDRLLAQSEEVPERTAMLAPSPPAPPRLDLSAQGAEVPRGPGAQLLRAFAGALRAVGAPGFDIDAPAAPLRLGPVVQADADVARLAIWALADSVWLDRDWRRPGEVNVVVVSDHVGVTNNGRALALTREFLAGRPVEPDVASWRGMLVPVIRYAFEPWRPVSI